MEAVFISQRGDETEILATRGLEGLVRTTSPGLSISFRDAR
jgi:hypothetical protein